MVTIYIDYRERALLDICESYDFYYKEKNLLVGDVHIIRDKDSLTYIIERKTMDDLSSSIIDGRYKEQKQRLLESGAYVIYIIENFNKKSEKGVNYDTLLSSLFLMQKRDNIHIIRTKDLYETFQYMKILTKKILDDGITKPSSICIQKKNHNTDVFMSMLLCIQGISTNIAMNIKRYFNSISEIVIYIQNSDKTDEAKFTHIDKIGKMLSQRICESLRTI